MPEAATLTSRSTWEVTAAAVPAVSVVVSVSVVSVAAARFEPPEPREPRRRPPRDRRDDPVLDELRTEAMGRVLERFVDLFEPYEYVVAPSASCVAFVRHRADLTYVLDQVNGELSVGHSFVGGGDYPDVETSQVGLLGADLVAAEGRWRIQRIYTLESWNPGLSAPLARPGIRAGTT